MRTAGHALATLATLALLAISPAGAAELPGPCEKTAVPSSFDTIKTYPSLTPRSFVKASYSRFETLGDRFDPGLASTWVLRDEASKRAANPASVDLESASATRVAYLFFEPKDITETATYHLFILTARPEDGRLVPKCTEYAGDIKFSGLDRYTFKLTPGFAPDASRTTGGDTNVGRLGIAIDVPSLVPNPYANLYFKFDGVLSTDDRDKQTKIEPRLGVERSLLDGWYVPGHLDVKYVGNQPGTDQSLASSAGIESLLPWAWAKGFFWNPLVKAPVSPVFGLSAEHEHILSENRTRTQTDQFRMAGTFHWDPIHLLARESDLATTKNVSLEVKTKFWWFPEEKTDDGNFRSPLEHRLDVSIVVPTAFLSQSGFDESLLAGVKLQGARFVLRYSTGANEANGFRNSSEFTFNVQYVK